MTNLIERRLAKIEAETHPPVPMEWERGILHEEEDTPERRAEITANGNPTIFRIIMSDMNGLRRSLRVLPLRCAIRKD
jgi:hypothetical protein